MSKKVSKKIVLANQDRSIDLEVEIERILEVLGFEDSLVTDESEIRDFIDIFATEEEQEEILYKLEEAFGFEVNIYDYIIDVAEQIKNNGKSKGSY